MASAPVALSPALPSTAWISLALSGPSPSVSAWPIRALARSPAPGCGKAACPRKAHPLDSAPRRDRWAARLQDHGGRAGFPASSGALAEPVSGTHLGALPDRQLLTGQLLMGQLFTSGPVRRPRS